MLVAIGITMIVVTGATTVIMQVVRDTESARARLEAVVMGRNVLRDLSFDLKEVVFHPDELLFYGYNVPGQLGDGIDNDNDGQIDNDRPDGRSRDGQFEDRHARIGQLSERPAFVGLPDLGDGGVDVDTVFDRDVLRFRVAPRPGSQRRELIYFIGEHEGEPNVLLREERTLLVNDEHTTTVEPLAYNVLGLNLLYWNANLATPYWVELWDTSARPFPGPGLELPASVYMSVAIHAGTQPLTVDVRQAARPLEAITLFTISNIEPVLADNRYITQVRAAGP